MIGKRIIQLGPIDSTNEYLIKQFNDKAELVHGEVFVSQEQLVGKGQGSNLWESEPGKNLTFSIFLLPSFLQADEQFYLNMAISLGVYDFVSGIVKENSVNLKWPNDIYVDNKKVGGILISHSISGLDFLYTIVGIGLNINQNKFISDAPNPASLSQFLEEELDLEICLKQLLSNINGRFQQLEDKKNELIKTDYLNALLGYKVWRNYIYNSQKIMAKIIGISRYGTLQLIDDQDERFECDFKEIEFTF